MSVETHPLNPAGNAVEQPAAEPASGFDPTGVSQNGASYRPPREPSRTPLAGSPEHRDFQAGQVEKPSGSNFGRFLMSGVTSLIFGVFGAWIYQRWLAPMIVSPTPAEATVSAAAPRDVKASTIGSSAQSDDPDNEQNKALLALRADFDRMRIKIYAIQLKLNGSDSVAKPQEPADIVDLRTKINELTIQSDRLNQIPARIRLLDERIEQLAVTLKSVRDDLRTVQEQSPKSGTLPRRDQTGLR